MHHYQMKIQPLDNHVDNLEYPNWHLFPTHQDMGNWLDLQVL